MTRCSGAPSLAQRVRFGLGERLQDDVEARRPGARQRIPQVARDVQVRPEIVVDRPPARDRLDRLRLGGKLVEHRDERAGIGETAEYQPPNGTARS